MFALVSQLIPHVDQMWLLHFQNKTPVDCFIVNETQQGGDVLYI